MTKCYSVFEDSDEDGLVFVRHEAVSLSLVELVLELDPVKSKGVEEALEEIHAHQHREGDGPESGPKEHRL